MLSLRKAVCHSTIRQAQKPSSGGKSFHRLGKTNQRCLLRPRCSATAAIDVRSLSASSYSSSKSHDKNKVTLSPLTNSGTLSSPLRLQTVRGYSYSWSTPHSQIAYFSTEPAYKTSQDEDTDRIATSSPTSTSGNYAQAIPAAASVPTKKFNTTTNTPLPSRKLGTTPVPTPPSAPPNEINPLQRLKDTTPKTVIRKGVDLLVSAFKTMVSFLIRLPGNLFFYATHPTETRNAWYRIGDMAKAEIHHYWVGTKLLWADIITARKLLNKTLGGSALTRRERKQLLRTVSDLFRLIPFSMFVLVPFMEFALPFALRLFPNMLPSTYQDSLKAEENMKRELKSRIAMAQFFQETLEELAKEQKRKASKRKKELEEAGVDLAQEGDTTIEAQNDSAGSMLEFLNKARNGEMIPPDVIIRYANYFKDDLTLDNMPRMQLINMCKYMSIQPYGSDSFLRFQLRHKIRVLKEDDQRILWEGIESLTKMELREACQERGMRSTGLSKEAYRRALQQWLDLSVNKDLPIALLIMSRTFFLREEMFQSEPGDESKSLAGLADTISGLDKEILNEVILEVATKEEKRSDPDVRKIKLEVLSQQNELIREEEQAREEAAKKAVADKEKSEKRIPIRDEPVLPPSSSMDSVAMDKMAPTSTSTSTTTAKLEASDASPPPPPPTVVVEKKDERKLSTEEMDAISHLISDDPVCKERMELERIKAAMKSTGLDSDTSATKVIDPTPGTVLVSEPTSSDLLGSAVSAGSPAEVMSSVDTMVRTSIQKSEEEAAAEADASTTVTLDAHINVMPSSPTSTISEVPAAPAALVEAEEEEVEEDPVIARLKKKVESMVGKIEVQLSETQVKIGDKLHFLDKDRDGILSREEMAAALQHVMKREISFEEAMAIANEMDNNQDGVFTIEELVQWIDEHKLLKLVKEGRDAEMDQIMNKQSISTSQPKAEENSSMDKPEKKL